MNRAGLILLKISQRRRELFRTPHADVRVALLVAALIFWLDLFVRFSAYQSLFKLLPLVGYIKFYGALLMAFLQSAAVLFVIVQFPKIVRIPVILVAVLIVLVQMSYFLAQGRYMTSIDLFNALTVGRDQVEGAIASFFDPVVSLYAVPYLFFLFVLLAVPYKFHPRKHLATIPMVALFLVVSNYVFFVKLQEKYFHLNPLASFIRAAFYCQFRSMLEYHGPRDELPEVQATERPKDSIIYIIDESIRGSQLSLNGYFRPTTPFLQALAAEGRLKNLGICVAASTYSYITNAYLISGHNEFPDKNFRTAKNPTIFDYAKKMGYKTVFIDVNESYLTIQTQRSTVKSIRSVDQWMTVRSFKERRIDIDTEKDMAVVRFISDRLNEAGGYFMVVIKKGLHFHYRTRYPDDPAYRLWKPVMELSEAIDPSPAGREKLVNTYDNGLRFVVDEFFQVLTSNTKNQNYVVLYTSDHGQTLSEQGQIYTHAKPDKVIADVPEFFVIGQRYVKQRLISSIPNGIMVSHLNNFATLLDLMEVPNALRVRFYEKSIFALTSEDNQVRYFLDGSLYGLGGNYEVIGIPTPPDEGWGFSHFVAKSAPAR